ncbi:alpha-glucuronidase family glycosyl hydrolase [Erythrobacter oryzae]|uniref:alpha-glucuronidase family glycosyl hydrolase n=1 Tax=Erythrobacter oryzae TaxID=3019556 RepID=UPI00255389E0|nr:alpha-glucuronidase family glycosyl hydrolase [Erythrobacter sp. COR-2]
MVAAALLAAGQACAEDGYALWLRHAPLEGEALADLREAAPIVPVIVGRPGSPTLAIAEAELRRGLAGLQGYDRPRLTRDSTEIVLSCGEEKGDGAAGFGIAPEMIEGRQAVVIAAEDHVGCLYGSFALLRALGEGKPLSEIRLTEAPTMPLRMLDHWDNPDGTVERGYAGRSIIDWWHLPEKLDPRLVDYARANASIGINAIAVNNVNAKAFMLEPRYIAKLARLADAWRPYGIRVFLSARFSAPMELGGLPTADPLDPAVKAWWKAKADEIYASIPDFGGFLVKANSEGQPGPQDYGRSHAEGANMLAAALGERGTVIWRAFVYRAEDSTDRTMQAYAEFQPLDGQFAGNVILQIKNGPLDFQPREPFHPLFGAMPRTRVMLEAQITREYLGQASGIAYLAPLWKEVLDADTGRGGTVAQIVAPTGMAGVANVGSDRNWTGTHFDQANWYAFGRLAWNPALPSEDIAREWAAQTFTRNPQPLGTITAMMLASRGTVVDYTGPMGLAHLMGTGHHYGPAPWVCDLERPDWNPCYYHRADNGGVGFDRTATGSNALAQYAPAVAAQWSDPATIDPRFLLWFHHMPWTHRLPSGRTLWEELATRYDAGVAGVDRMAADWASLAPAIDPERHAAVAGDLSIQRKEARWWRDASLAYWQSVNGLPLPPDTAPPAEPLDAYRQRKFPEAPGQ